MSDELDFGLVRKMRQNLTTLLNYLADTEIQDTPWKNRTKEQLLDLGQELLFLRVELDKYLEIGDIKRPYDLFRSLLEHFESIEHKINKINPLVLGELRDRFDFFNQFEANLFMLLEQLRGQTFWEEDEELRAMPRRRGRKRKSKFVKDQQLVAKWGGEWLPVTIRDVLPNKYYNVHWTNSDEISSVHEDEITDPTSPADKAAALRARIAAAKSVSALAAQAKPKKKTKKTAAGQSSHSFPFGIPAPLVKSFNDFFEETCRVDFTNSKPSDSGLLMVGDVHKEYRAWCTKNKRPYCPERTSKEWERAPFVVNNRRADRLPPFRLLMFAKLDRLSRRVKDVYSSTETAWRRHKNSYVGHPYYQGLQWKDSFTPTLKYVHVKKKALSAVDMFDSITRGW